MSKLWKITFVDTGAVLCCCMSAVKDRFGIRKSNLSMNATT